jgi:hypothetical protein
VPLGLPSLQAWTAQHSGKDSPGQRVSIPDVEGAGRQGPTVALGAAGSRAWGRK